MWIDQMTEISEVVEYSFFNNLIIKLKKITNVNIMTKTVRQKDSKFIVDSEINHFFYLPR